MTLPASRDLTYVPDVTPPNANNLNRIQDQIIALAGDAGVEAGLLMEAFFRRGWYNPGKVGASAQIRPLGGAGIPLTTGSDLNVSFGGGLLLEDMIIGSELRWGFMPGTTLAVTAGHATLPRWDIFSWRMVNATNRKGTVDVVYTAGTPNASPAEPSVPAGYQKLARVEVAATATVLTAEMIVDFRKPLGETRFHLPLSNGISATWVLQTTHDWQAAAATNILQLPLLMPFQSDPVAGSSSCPLRIKSIEFSGKIKKTGGTPGSVQLYRKENATYPIVFTQVQTAIEADITDNTQGWYACTSKFSDASNTPWWLGGVRNPLSKNSERPISILQITAGDAADEVQDVALVCWGRL